MPESFRARRLALAQASSVMSWLGFLRLMLLLAVAGCGGVSVSPDYESARLATIQQRWGTGVRSGCGGVAVSSRVVVTIAHCSRGETLKYVTRQSYLRNQEPETATLIECNIEPSLSQYSRDGWCAYRTKRELEHWADPVIECDRPVGFFVGHGADMQWRVVGPAWLEPVSSTNQWDATGFKFVPGDSGGPVFCETGEVLGVMADAEGRFHTLAGIHEVIE